MHKLFPFIGSSAMSSSKDGPRLSVVKGREVHIEEVFLHRLLEDSIVKNKLNDKTALIYSDENVPKRETKFSELNMNANQMAYTLLDTINASHSQANSDGDWIIAVCMKPSDDLVTTLLGIWKAGAAYLPLDYAYPENRVEHILKEAKPVMVIYDDSYTNVKYFAKSRSIKFSDLKRESMQLSTANIPDMMMLTGGDANTKALILYTSGSTGLPKGVRIRHHTFIHRMLWQFRTFPFSDTEKHCVFKTALVFADHVAELWCPLSAGRTVVIVPKEMVNNPELFVPILEDYKVERVVGVPTLLRSILLYLNMLESNKTKYVLSNLKMWVSSGEPLSVQTANDFFDYFENGRQTLANFYGCTEISCEVLYHVMKSKQDLMAIDKVPLGIPFDNTIVYILNKDKQIMNQGDIGEICAAGVPVSDGYIAGRDPGAFFKNPHVASPSIFSKMYKSGDYGFMKNGLLHYEGRRDSQIKVRGHRIDIAEIEKVISQLEYLQKSAILVYHTGQPDQALVAFIETRKINDQPITRTPMEIEQDLKPKLANYMMPKVIVIEEFPHMATGKIDRQELLKMYETLLEESKKETAIEFDLKNIPKEKLRAAREVFEIVGRSIGAELRGKLSTDSNFYDLGGNSMNSILTVTALRKKGYFISITDFIKAKNLGEMLDKISATKKPRGDDMNITTDFTLVNEPIDHLEQDQCIKLLSLSFFNKADLDRFLPGLKIEHYYEILGQLWDSAVKKGLSFMVKTVKGDLMGVSLNFDVEDEPQIEVNNSLAPTMEFLEHIEMPVIKNQLKPTIGQVFHAFMMGTSESLTSRENITVMAFMENEVIKLATNRGFKGIISTNTNPLTQQFGESVFGYEKLHTAYVNKFVDHNGNRPFAAASETQTAVVMYKNLR